MTTLSDICKDVLSNFPNFPVPLLKNAIAVMMDDLNIDYKKDVPFMIKYKEKVIGEDMCDFVINGIPYIIGSSTTPGYSDKLIASKLMRCMTDTGAQTGVVILFKNTDMYHQPILIREYNVSGNLVNEFAGRTALPIRQ